MKRSAPGVPILTDDSPTVTAALRMLPVCRRLPTPCPEPGIYHDIPDAQYHSWAAVSQSLLKLCLDEFDGGCPAILRHYLDTTEDKPTDEMAFGTAYHTLALQGEKVFRERYPAIIQHEQTGPRGGKKRLTRRDPEWTSAVETWGEGAVLWDDDVLRMREMLAVLQGHKAMGPIVGGPGKREVAIVWDDADFNIRCKCRIDWLHELYTADLKTAANASPHGFGASAGRLGYHVQAAFANRGLAALNAAGKSPRGARPFIFAAQRKEAPYLVGVYAADAGEIANGNQHVRAGLAEITRCLDTGEWPGYGDAVQQLLLPVWCGGPGRNEEGID